jgi:hypothetical protein
VLDAYNIDRIRSPNSDDLAGLRIVVASLFNVSLLSTAVETKDDMIDKDRDRYTMSIGLGPPLPICESRSSSSGSGWGRSATRPAREPEIRTMSGGLGGPAVVAGYRSWPSSP